MAVQGPTFLLYDRDCRVCRASARFVRCIDLRRGIRIRPIQESRELLRSLPEESVLDAAHAIDPDGRVTSGAEAMPVLAGALLGAPQVERRLRASPSAMRVLARFYGFLVGLRGRLTCGVAAPSSEACAPR